METIKETYEETRARELAEEEANLKRLKNIAKILKLKYDEPSKEGYTRAWLRGATVEGFTVILTANQYHCKGKVNASISFITERDGVRVYLDNIDKVQDINESLNKTDEVIASNIQKRIFAQALTTQSKIEVLILEAVAKKSNHDKNIEHFAKLLGVKTSGGHRVEEKIYINEYHKFFEANVEVKGNSEGNEFNIDLRYLNFRQAEAVLTALKSVK